LPILQYTDTERELTSSELFPPEIFRHFGKWHTSQINVTFHKVKINFTMYYNPRLCSLLV